MRDTSRRQQSNATWIGSVLVQELFGLGMQVPWPVAHFPSCYPPISSEVDPEPFDRGSRAGARYVEFSDKLRFAHFW